MAQLPDAVEQIRQVHAQFIHGVVRAVHNPAQLPELHAALEGAESQGWGRLVTTLRKILNGQRDRSVLLGLDDEDRVIAEAILAGIENPATLPPLEGKPNAGAAAPGLAAMIDGAARGDVQALHALANMAEQMVKGGGDMARLGAIMRRLIDGERDPDLLTRGMGALGRGLVLDILNELAQQRPQ